MYQMPGVWGGGEADIQSHDFLFLLYCNSYAQALYYKPPFGINMYLSL